MPPPPSTSIPASASEPRWRRQVILLLLGVVVRLPLRVRMALYYRPQPRRVLRWIGADVVGVYPAGPPDQRSRMTLSVNESWPYLLGVYEHAIMTYLRRVVRPGATVIDVGGHTGYHAIYLAHLVGPDGQVVVVEPVAELVDELAANFRLNGLANCRVIPVAVAATDSEIDLFVPKGKVRSTIATTDPSRAEQRDHERRRVPARSLDGIAEEIGGRVDLVKIDVEGAEAPALAGASTLLDDPGCTVVLELNEWVTVESQEVLQLLRDAGRDLEVIGMRGLTAFLAATRAEPTGGS